MSTGSYRSARMQLLIVCALCVLTLGTFWRVVRNDFVPFDDDIEILHNTHIQGGMTGENLAWMFTDVRQTERYTPLSWVAWAAICAAAGLNAAAFHAEALVVHVINTVLVFLALCEILPWLLRNAGAGVRALCAGLVAAVWGVHPLRVEVVAWVTQARFAEATLFALLAFLFYARLVRFSEDSPRRRVEYWLALACYAASVLFYPNGIGLYVVFFLLDVLILRSGVKRAALRCVPFVLPAIFVAFMTVYGRFADAGSAHAAVGLGQFDLSHRMMQAAYMFVFFLWKPFDILHVSPIYTTLVHFDPFSPVFVVSFVAAIVLTGAAVVLRKAYPGFAFLWFSHLALIVPVGGYFEFPYYPSDRYGYLVTILWTAAGGIVLFRGWGRWRPAMRACIAGAVGVVVVMLAMLAFAQVNIWRNGETLYRYVLADLGAEPYAVDIHVRLARYYLDQGRLELAIAEEQAALSIGPSYPPAVRMREALIRAVAERAASGRASESPAATSPAHP